MWVDDAHYSSTVVR